MRKVIMAITLAVSVVTAGFGAVALAEDKSVGYMQDTTTDVFLVDSITPDGLLNCVPVNPKVDGGYMLDESEGYELGDIVEITYWNDDTIDTRKLFGKELVNITKTFGKNIEAIEGKYLKQDKALDKLFSKKGKSGVSANTTKVRHELKDKKVTLAIKNDNNFKVGVMVEPEKYVNGKYVGLEWYDFGFLKSEEKSYLKYSKEMLKMKKGTYRFKVTAYRYDRAGFVSAESSFYSGKFLVK